MATIRKLKKPVVACVNGYCFGAGFRISKFLWSLHCIRNCNLWNAEVKIGIPSVIEAALLPFIVGLNKTRELLLSGEIIGAAEAEKNRVV
jgi:enoyl-CoA hydratase/carnithine racemase